MLTISIKISEVSTDISTDQNLSFDAIDSIVSRAVQSTLQAYLSMPKEDRLAPYRAITNYEDDEEDD
jgi:hypothetical protein